MHILPGQFTDRCGFCELHATRLHLRNWLHRAKWGTLSEDLASCTCNVGYTGPDGGPCTACVPGKYKGLVGAGSCDDCDTGKISSSPAAASCPSVPSSSSPETTSPFKVTMAVSIPLALSEFNDAKRASFKEAFAQALGVSSSDVSIDIVESISIARRAARRLLAPGIKVGISVKAASKNAADTMVSKLTATNINAKLQEAGLPPATIVEAPKTEAREETVKADGNSDAVQEEESLVKEAGKELILGIVGAIGGAIGMAILGYLYKKFGMQDPNAPAPASSGQSQEAGRPGMAREQSTRPEARNIQGVSSNLVYGPGTSVGAGVKR